MHKQQRLSSAYCTASRCVASVIICARKRAPRAPIGLLPRLSENQRKQTSSQPYCAPRCECQCTRPCQNSQRAEQLNSNSCSSVLRANAVASDWIPSAPMPLLRKLNTPVPHTNPNAQPHDKTHAQVTDIRANAEQRAGPFTSGSAIDSCPQTPPRAAWLRHRRAGSSRAWESKTLSAQHISMLFIPSASLLERVQPRIRPKRLCDPGDALILQLVAA